MLENRNLMEFEGRWRITRHISHSGGSEARFSGMACFTPAQDGLDYVESGTLQLPGTAPMQAEQRNHWGRGLAVSFADGRPFHVIPPQGGAVAHWCPPDHYDGTYDFSDWPAWQVTWKVRGPRKDYRSLTLYTR